QQQPVRVERSRRDRDFEARNVRRRRVEGMRVVDAAADARPDGRHDGDRAVPGSVRGPVLHARKLEQIDGIERVVAELDLRDVAAAGEPEADAGAYHPTLVERRVPRRLQALRRSEGAAERRADVLAEDVGDAMALLADVQGHPDRLHHVAHSPPPTRSRSAKTCSYMLFGSGCGPSLTRLCAASSSALN